MPHKHDAQCAEGCLAGLGESTNDGSKIDLSWESRESGARGWLCIGGCGFPLNRRKALRSYRKRGAVTFEEVMHHERQCKAVHSAAVAAPAAATSVRRAHCLALTQRGKPCVNAPMSNGYCGVAHHQRQAECSGVKPIQPPTVPAAPAPAPAAPVAPTQRSPVAACQCEDQSEDLHRGAQRTDLLPQWEDVDSPGGKKRKRCLWASPAGHPCHKVREGGRVACGAAVPFVYLLACCVLGAQTFATKSSLNRHHRQVHLGEKKFKCNLMVGDFERDQGGKAIKARYDRRTKTYKDTWAWRPCGLAAVSGRLVRGNCSGGGGRGGGRLEREPMHGVESFCSDHGWQAWHLRARSTPKCTLSTTGRCFGRVLRWTPSTPGRSV